MKNRHAISSANPGIVCCRAMFRDIALPTVVSIILFVIPSLAAMAQSLTNDTLSVSINFRQGYSNLDLGFMGNKETLDSFVKAYNTHPHKASTIFIIGYASPEGTVAANQRLSQKRADVIASYLTTNYNISADSIACLPIGVDWQDLYTAVLADHNVPEREKVLDIITNVSDIVSDSHGVLISQRNIQLQHLDGGRAWSYMLENIYPRLRGAKAEVVCIVDLPEPEEAKIPENAETLVEEEMVDIECVTPPLCLT